MRIFALIALQRNTEEPDAKSDHEIEDDCREKNPCGFQNCVAFRLALHGFFNETTDYSPRCPGKQHKRAELLALSLAMDEARRT
jgi:hypothetical protein